MTSGEITKLALERRLIKCSGKTPENTMASALYTEVRKRPLQTSFIKCVAWGVLNPWGRASLCRGFCPPLPRPRPGRRRRPPSAAPAASSRVLASASASPSPWLSHPSALSTPPASASAPQLARPKEGLFGLKPWLHEAWLLDMMANEGIEISSFLPPGWDDGAGPLPSARSYVSCMSGYRLQARATSASAPSGSASSSRRASSSMSTRSKTVLGGFWGVGVERFRG